MYNLGHFPAALLGPSIFVDQSLASVGPWACSLQRLAQVRSPIVQSLLYTRLHQILALLGLHVLNLFSLYARAAGFGCLD